MTAVSVELNRIKRRDTLRAKKRHGMRVDESARKLARIKRDRIKATQGSNR